MKLKTILAVMIFTLGAFATTSCNKEGDSIKPTIDLHEPEDGEAFKPGSTMCIEMDLSDNTALASFKINIHNNFDGHNHSKCITKHADDNYNSNTANAFTYNKTSKELGEDIEGLKNTHRHLHIDIPADAANGDYHLMVYCNDIEGNESYVARSIAISDDAEEHHHNE